MSSQQYAKPVTVATFKDGAMLGSEVQAGFTFAERVERPSWLTELLQAEFPFDLG